MGDASQGPGGCRHLRNDGRRWAHSALNPLTPSFYAAPNNSLGGIYFQPLIFWGTWDLSWAYFTPLPPCHTQLVSGGGGHCSPSQGGCPGDLRQPSEWGGGTHPAPPVFVQMRVQVHLGARMHCRQMCPTTPPQINQLGGQSTGEGAWNGLTPPRRLPPAMYPAGQRSTGHLGLRPAAVREEQHVWMCPHGTGHSRGIWG